jgi:hypothetical protein
VGQERLGPSYYQFAVDLIWNQCFDVRRKLSLFTMHRALFISLRKYVVFCPVNASGQNTLVLLEFFLTVQLDILTVSFFCSFPDKNSLCDRHVDFTFGL